MNIQLISLFLATMTTGLMAGIFFTWTNAVTPGIGKLTDKEYLSALQAMNRDILNPVFYLLFFCPVITLPLATVVHYESGYSLLFKLLFVASAIYLIGVFFITIWGNIPLNNLLDKTELGDISHQSVRNLRDAIETKWNNFNLIRSITSSVSFILLILICLLVAN